MKNLDFNIPARRPDWRARLAQFCAEAADKKFRPGSHDCAMFVAGAVAAMTGHDPAAALRGSYRSLNAAKKRLKKSGHADHVELIADHLKEVPPSLARAGDVAVVDGAGDTAALGIVQGAGVYCLAPAGLAVVSRLKIKRAFEI